MKFGHHILFNQKVFRVLHNLPTVFQERNEHDLIKDMKKEFLGYENNLKLLNDIKMQSTSIFKFLPERSLEFFNISVYFLINEKNLDNWINGFVGRHFTNYFLNKGYQVLVVDSIAKYTGALSPEKWKITKPLDFKNFKFEKSDCRKWFNRNNITDFDYVFHLAAMVGGREMIENNPIAVADDLSIDSHFWQWAVKNMPKKVIQFSSSACYPVEFQTKNNYFLLKENMIDFNKHIGTPDLTYGWAKLT